MLGMARLMHQSLIQKKIKDLSATYLTLSFAEIAEKTQLPVESLEVQLTKMVQSKAISAKINKKQGTVDFIDSEGDGDDELVSQADFEMIKKIETQNERIVSLLKRVEDTTEKIRQSDDYLSSKARKEVRGAGAGADEEMADEGI